MCGQRPTGLHTRSLAIAVGLVLSQTPILVHAQQTADEAAGAPGYPRILFNGFGALGITHSTEDRADYQATGVQPDGPGFSDELSFELDSRVAAQLTVDLAPRLRAIVQVIAEERWDDSYGPTLEWANVGYGITPDLTVRAGRTAFPIFMVSDFRKVSYANPWVRPPVELYHLIPVYAIDGLDASYRLHVEGWTNTVHALFGRSDTDLPAGGGTAESRDVWGVFDTFERGPLKARVGIASGRITTDSANVLFDLFREFGPQGEAIADRYELDDDRVTFWAAGLGYDPGAWFVSAEFGRISSDTYIGRSIGWYVSGGPRIGPVTPYATFAGTETTSETSSPGLDTSALPPEAAAAATALDAGLNEVLGGRPAQRTLSLGLRWDLLRNVALKLQVDRIDVLEGSPGTFMNRQPGFERGGSAWLLNAGTAFVF